MIGTYTFDNFIVGDHNRLAYSAAVAVAEQPGHMYNLLFIFGGVGLGKTHLLQGIRNQTHAHLPENKVLYISTERLISEFINSIREHRSDEFRKRYRELDVLLIDDTQFIAGKERIQEEFFRIFDDLRDTGKQIVLTCDKPPKSIPLLDERLGSLFEQGLIADIQPPDFETRLALLRKHCELNRSQVPHDVIEYIASIFTTNVRELQGALNRIVAYSQLTNSSISLSDAGQLFNRRAHCVCQE